MLSELAGRVATRFGDQIDVAIDPGVSVHAQPTALEPALTNLLDNARRDGAEPIEITPTPATTGSSCTSSTTARASPTTTYRTPSSTSAAQPGRAAAGAGLSLALVEALAHAHGGEAGAANAPRGTDVWRPCCARTRPAFSTCQTVEAAQQSQRPVWARQTHVARCSRPGQVPTISIASSSSAAWRHSPVACASTRVVVFVISCPPARRPWPIHVETPISGTPAASSREEKVWRSAGRTRERDAGLLRSCARSTPIVGCWVSRVLPFLWPVARPLPRGRSLQAIASETITQLSPSRSPRAQRDFSRGTSAHGPTSS